jgi:beta-N-acetylhexosaminidase
MKRIAATVFTAIIILASALRSTGVVVAPTDSPSPIVTEVRIDRTLARMSVREKVGQLFMIDLRPTEGHPVLTVTEAVRDMLETYTPGGVLLFGENIDTVEQTVELTNRLQELSPYPLAIGTDYEGGVVSRLTSSGKIPATRIPPSREIGDTGDPELAYEVGRVMGSELRSLGITMNFAPVADVLSNPDAMIGNRAFSDDPDVVAVMTGAMVRGIQEEDVSAVVKHFPGHGDTLSDTHDRLVVLPYGRPRLYSVEFVPFRAAIEAGVDGVMAAHIVVPEITGAGIPATLSYELLTRELRDHLGHDKLIVTDSLTMRAIRNSWDSGESTVQAILAGADIILQPLRLDTAFEAVLKAIGERRISEDRLDRSVRRILEVKLARGMGNPVESDPYAILGSEEHRLIIARIREEAE